MAASEAKAVAAKVVEEASYFSQITLSDWLMALTSIVMVIAVLRAPVIALRIQSSLQDRKEKRDRKLRIFRTLLTNRATRLSPAYVEALNMIDIEFSADKPQEKKVLGKWKEYLDHLLNFPKNGDTSIRTTWLNRCDDYVAELLEEMSQCVGYKFDKVYLKRNIYTPQAHGDIEMDNDLIRMALVDILTGKKTLPMSLTLPDDVIAKQNEVHDKLVDYLDGKTAIKVKIEKEE